MWLFNLLILIILIAVINMIANRKERKAIIMKGKRRGECLRNRLPNETAYQAIKRADKGEMK